MATLEKLRKIHFDYLYDGLYDIMPIADNHSDNDELVKAVLFSGIGTILTHRNWDIVKNKVKNNTHVFLTSVNFKRQKYPSNFLVYINETRSNIRKTTLVRECSLISKISVLLFSNRNLGIIEIDKENFSENIPSTDQVKLRLDNTNVELLCDRVQAQELINCKDALMAGYRYYIQQLTEIGEPNSKLTTLGTRFYLYLRLGFFKDFSVGYAIMES
ncbi:hypothetical protein NQ318_022948 [Aromia moschata]|uniref:Uncharacterized protein n=1 Tax=Aromia moschata TaxID=1265417 RepID=A0AAV8X1L7_9CUCU|nr:hypothetical protein NQ318_022948 [Aromia moschata]